MGCSFSLPFPGFKKHKEMPHHHHHHHALRMHRLVRPAIYAGKRPSFEAAYARAARRYKFGVGVYPIYAFKNDLVYRVRALGQHASGSGNEVPASSIQNGE